MAQDRSDRMAGETSAPMWISTLETLGRQFEAKRATFPDLYHWLSLATPAFGARKHGHPIVSSANSTQIVTDHGGRTIWSMARGIAYGDAKKGYLYTAAFFGGKDDRESVLGAIDEFDRLGEAVARCLPAHIARSLAIPPYLDPRCGGTTLQWILALYAIAWRTDPTTGLSADRKVEFWEPGECVYGIVLEHLFRLPNVIQRVTAPSGLGMIPVPPTPKEAEIGRFLNSRVPGGPTWAQRDVRFPPDWFYAFLKPDVFLASKLAIDVILQAWRPVPPPRSTSPPAPDPWRDTTKSVSERLTHYMVHCQGQGRMTRPPSKELSEVLGCSAERVRNTGAWKAWGKLEVTGKSASMGGGRTGRHSDRVNGDRARRNSRDQD